MWVEQKQKSSDSNKKEKLKSVVEEEAKQESWNLIFKLLLLTPSLGIIYYLVKYWFKINIIIE